MGFLIKWTVRGILLALLAAVLHSCGSTRLYSDDDLPAQHSPAPTAGRPAQQALLQQVAALEADTPDAWAHACLAALEATGADAPDAGPPCEVALTAADPRRRPLLEAAVLEASDGALALRLAYERAAAGDAADYAVLAQHLERQAGDTRGPYVALDADSLTAAAAAAARAGDTETLARLRDAEFPFFGTRQEPLWRALYFGDFDAIEDTVIQRRHVAGAATAIADLCAQWEPPGIRSVAFDTGLESFLAPVRAQVPARIVGAVPRVGAAVGRVVLEGREGAAERTATGWLDQAMRGWQDIKREALNGVAVGSTVGRDAAQVLFNEATSCRSRRGLKFIDALTRYFEYRRHALPVDGGARRSTSSGSQT
jgi:hypothetical protein